MKQFSIVTPVKASYQMVWEGFNRDLFVALAPAFPRLEIVEYKSNFKDDRICLKLHTFGFSVSWVSVITAYVEHGSESFFIDEGEVLPFPLKKWKHQHIVRKTDRSTEIEDNISFSTGFSLLDELMAPLLKIQFKGRIPIYQKYFEKE